MRKQIIVGGRLNRSCRRCIDKRAIDCAIRKDIGTTRRHNLGWLCIGVVKLNRTCAALLCASSGLRIRKIQIGLDEIGIVVESLLQDFAIDCLCIGRGRWQVGDHAIETH